MLISKGGREGGQQGPADLPHARIFFRSETARCYQIHSTLHNGYEKVY